MREVNHHITEAETFYFKDDIVLVHKLFSRQPAKRIHLIRGIHLSVFVVQDPWRHDFGRTFGLV